MKYFLIIIFVFLGCRNNRQAQTKVVDAKKLFNSVQDPYTHFIPDSLKHYIPIFDSVFNNDQRFRSVEDHSLFTKHILEQTKLDSVNQTIVSDFLAKYGYPSGKQVGLKGITAINSVIQHAPLKMQERYYLTLVDAYRDKKIPGETLALLEDRINLRNHRKQFYGTQVLQFNKTGKYTLYPVTNIDSLNAYRKRIGFNMTIEQYLKQFFKTDWTKADYYKNYAEAVKQFEVTDSPSIHFDVLPQ